MPVENHRNHPDVHQPWAEWSEEQTLHIVGVYNNPFRWRTRRELFNDWKRHMRATVNVKLYVVEMAYGDRPFEVTDPATFPGDIQLRSDQELWYKENLINIGVSRFPPNWRYGGYSDGDFTFTRYDWPLEAIHMLQHHAFVQLFSSYSDLTDETSTSWTGHRPYRINSSFAWNYTHPATFLENKTSAVKGLDPYYGLTIPMSKTFPFGFPPGAPGGAWAWTRSAFDTVGGMLDSCLLGSGDWHMALGLIQESSARLETLHTGNAYNKCILDWQKRAKRIEKNIGCIDNFAVHHYHGSHKSRGYGDRWQILVNHDFDPSADAHKDWQGAWRLSGNKPAMRDDIRRYFIERMEDQSGDQKPIV